MGVRSSIEPSAEAVHRPVSQQISNADQDACPKPLGASPKAAPRIPDQMYILRPSWRRDGAGWLARRGTIQFRDVGGLHAMEMDGCARGRAGVTALATDAMAQRRDRDREWILLGEQSRRLQGRPRRDQDRSTGGLVQGPRVPPAASGCRGQRHSFDQRAARLFQRLRRGLPRRSADPPGRRSGDRAARRPQLRRADRVDLSRATRLRRPRGHEGLRRALAARTSRWASAHPQGRRGGGRAAAAPTGRSLAASRFRCSAGIATPSTSAAAKDASRPSACRARRRCGDARPARDLRQRRAGRHSGPSRHPAGRSHAATRLRGYERSIRASRWSIAPSPTSKAWPASASKACSKRQPSRDIFRRSA